MTLLTDFGGALLYFTLLLPIWKERPLDTKDIVPGSYPLEVTDQQVEFSQQGFQYADEDLKAVMMQAFGKSLNKAARDALLDAIKDSDAPAVVATGLLQVGNLPLDDPELGTKLAEYFNHDDWRVRYWAVSTYSKLPAAEADILLQTAQEDESVRVKTAALDGLYGRAGEIPFAEFAELLDQAEPMVKYAAWRTALGAVDADKYLDEILATATDGDVATRCSVACGLAQLPVETAIELAGEMAVDVHSSVRAETAHQLGSITANGSRDILLQLTGDADYEVRRSAVEALVIFPQQAVIEKLISMLGDEHKFVRQQVEESLVAIHPKSPVDLLTMPVLASDDANARLYACNVLGRIGVEKHRQAIAASLLERSSSEPVADQNAAAGLSGTEKGPSNGHLSEQEKTPTPNVQDPTSKIEVSRERPENISAALTALDRLGYSTSDAVILPYISHENALVRKAAAGALGNLNTDAADAALIELSADADNDVVATAIESMGRVGKAVFSDRLLKILKDTGMRARYTAEHRARACWAAGKLPSLDKSLLRRIVQQGTTPVIRTPMGNLFEDDRVLVSVSFALAEQSRKNPEYRKYFDKVYNLHSKELSQEKIMRAGDMALVPTPELIEYSGQAKAWLDGVRVEPGLRPKRSMQFVYRPCQ